MPEPLPYRAGRHTDARLAARVHEALGAAESILHVSPGAGTYAPANREVTGAAPDRGRLPFEDDQFDASMSCLATFDWGQDWPSVLAEMRRVTSGPLVILTLDLPHLAGWQKDYLAPVIAIERARTPTPAELAPFLGRRTRIDALRTPIDCEDGFIDALWARPEAFLDADVRAAQPAWAELAEHEVASIVGRLQTDLVSGAWYADHGHLRSHADYDGALRLIVDDPAAVSSLPRNV
ncbi:MAG: methyltransferase domain-containing protein [Baekduia sp.]